MANGLASAEDEASGARGLGEQAKRRKICIGKRKPVVGNPPPDAPKVLRSICLYRSGCLGAFSYITELGVTGAGC